MKVIETEILMNKKIVMKNSISLNSNQMRKSYVEFNKKTTKPNIHILNYQ